MTTFTGLGGAAGFFGSTFGGIAATGGGGVVTGLPATAGAATADLAAAAWATGALDAVPEAGCGFAAAGWTLEREGAAGLDILDTAGFFVGTGAVFLPGAAGATFLATGLAILLDTGAFLALLLAPDDWTGFEADFFAGTIFLTVAVFLAGFAAAFFLVAIQLGFFSNKHF
jgi:hypothetical protein